jgi:hypothetical protein
MLALTAAEVLTLMGAVLALLVIAILVRWLWHL